MTISVDASQLGRLSADLTRAGTRVQQAAFDVVKKVAGQVKKDAVANATGIGHAPHYPRSISYTIYPHGLRTIEAEIGPDKNGPQGALGNILEFGTSKNAPIPHLQPALDANQARFERLLQLAAVI